MAKSKARYLADILQGDGSLVFSGDLSVPSTFTIDPLPDGAGGTVTIGGDLTSTGGVNNASLQNDSITINSYVTALGESVTLDTDDVDEGVRQYFTTARVDSHLSGGTGVTYNAGEIAIGQAVATSDSVTFDQLTVSTSANIPYDNSISGLTATTVQSALSELTVLTGGGNIGSQANWNIYEFTATASQTTFDLSALSPAVSYVPGYIQVYLNGILLAESEYTASNGSTVVLNSGATVGHSISIVVLDSFNTATQLRVLSIDAAAPDNSLSISSSGALTTGGFTFPTADGSADQVLKTNGSGSLSFQPIPTSLVVGQRTAPVAVSVINAQFTVASRSGNVTIGVS